MMSHPVTPSGAKISANSGWCEMSVTPILLHRNDTDCQKERSSRQPVSQRQTLTDTSNIQHFSSDLPHLPKSRTVCNFGSCVVDSMQYWLLDAVSKPGYCSSHSLEVSTDEVFIKSRSPLPRMVISQNPYNCSNYRRQLMSLQL